MKITKKLFFATALAMLLFSCTNEELNEAEVTKGVVAGGVTYASVYLEDATAIFTKAATPDPDDMGESEEERKIHNLSFFIFDADGARDTAHGYCTFNYTGSQYTFAMTTGENKTIIAAANLQHVGDLPGADLETVRHILTTELGNKTRNMPLYGASMAGESSGITAIPDDVKVIKMQVGSTYIKQKPLSH